jgi:hypothetical protein
VTARRGEADAETITPWTSDMRDLAGYPLVQWEVRFDIGSDFDEVPFLAVDRLVVRFRVE